LSAGAGRIARINVSPGGVPYARVLAPDAIRTGDPVVGPA
jgi:hypothetical protein